MHTLTAADFADTGQWRLLLKIKASGMEAFLENTLHKDIPPQPLCNVEWAEDPKKLCKNIEEAVYNNPRLLDDFATKIIIYEPLTIFIPTKIAEESAGAEEELYNAIFPADSSDILTDFDADITAAWAPGPGVKSFLMRTFPGARITSNLMEEVRNLRKTNQDISLYIFVRTGEADFVLLDGSQLVSASTREWNRQKDLTDFVDYLLDAYSFRLSDVRIYLEGDAGDSQEWEYICKNSKS